MAFASHFTSVLSCPQCSPEVTWLVYSSALCVSVYIDWCLFILVMFTSFFGGGQFGQTSLTGGAFCSASFVFWGCAMPYKP